MLDIKVLQATLDQLEEERNIPRERIVDAVEQSLAAAYKKEYGKKGQIVRCKLDLETGDAEYSQIKIVVDDTLVRPALEEGEEEEEPSAISLQPSATKDDQAQGSEEEEEDLLPRFNPEHHIYIEDAKRIKSNVELEEELVFPLEPEEDFGRIAAQTAKQVILQRIREAEKESVMDEYAERQGEIVSGIVQKVDRGTIFVDFNRVTGVLPYEEQIHSEHYKTGDRVKAYLYLVEETPRGVSLRLSRTHPRFIEALFMLESPEVAAGTVEIKHTAREAGNRSKIAVATNDEAIDPIGALVGQRGVRVTTVMSELGGERIDIIPYSEDIAEFIANALSPARVLDIKINEEEHIAEIEVADDQLSLAIGKGGQNVRLAAKLTGWKIDIKGVEGETLAEATEEGEVELPEEETTETKTEATESEEEPQETTEEEVPEE